MTKTSPRERRNVQTELPGTVRIIAGKWRRRHLDVIDARELRPTPNRVRETLFAWLSAKLPGSRCLDLFAGSGALGFEAASRGAGEVVMIERDSTLVAALLEQRARFDAQEVRVIQADAIRWLENGRDEFDIIFIDPPFQKYDLGELCGRVERCGRLRRSGMVYLETGVGAPELSLPEDWVLSRRNRAGQVRYYLAVRNAG